MSYSPQTFPSAEGLTKFQADTVPPDDLQTILAAFQPVPWQGMQEACSAVSDCFWPHGL